MRNFLYNQAVNSPYFSLLNSTSDAIVAETSISYGSYEGK